MQRNKISFKGQKIFVGIDVHKSTWAVAVAPQIGPVRQFSQIPSAKALFDFLKKNYPEGDYMAAYEAGFTGFSTYYALKEHGIKALVVHAADIPSTQYENMMKTDRIDAAKIARSLKNGELKSVYVREKENIDDLNVLRIRKTIQKQLAGYKTRVKHLLHTNGVEMPERFAKPSTQWSRAFIKWLSEDVQLLSSSRNSLDLLISQVETIRKSLLNATRMMRKLSLEDRYRDKYNLLISIPGIGAIVAMTILVEIFDFSRFHNERQFASYLGVIPTSHSSGDKTVHGEMTSRGNKHLSIMLIESAWVAITRDEGLANAYLKYRQKMNPQKAIVKVARKMSNIIFAVLKTNKAYVPYRWDN